MTKQRKASCKSMLGSTDFLGKIEIAETLYFFKVVFTIFPNSNFKYNIIGLGFLCGNIQGFPGRCCCTSQGALFPQNSLCAIIVPLQLASPQPLSPCAVMFFSAWEIRHLRCQCELIIFFFFCRAAINYL